MTNCRGLPLRLDCSDDAQAERRRQLAALLAKMRSGVSSVSDRGRSVTYQNNANLWLLLLQLRNEIDACDLGRWPGRRSLSYIDLVKGL